MCLTNLSFLCVPRLALISNCNGWCQLREVSLTLAPDAKISVTAKSSPFFFVSASPKEGKLAISFWNNSIFPRLISSLELIREKFSVFSLQ